MKHLKYFNESIMVYPSMEEVENADGYQILKWHRFLPNPQGEQEEQIINRIFARYGELSHKGEINSNTSKRVGWRN